MSRTRRRIPEWFLGWSSYRSYLASDDAYLDVLRRGHRQLEKLHWPKYAGWWGWNDDTPNSPRGQKWLKRYTSKYRRRRGKLEIQQQLK